MKNNISEWLFNPFRRIAGYEAFFVGLFIAVLTSIIAALSKTAFDGVLDMHLSNDLSIGKSLIFLLINIVSLVTVMYFAGLTIAKGFRFADMLGTLTLARFPLIFIALAGFMAEAPDLNEILSNPLIIFQNTGFILMMIISLPILIWVIVLKFRAFKTTTGASGNKLTAAFIIGIIFAEMISKLLIYLIFK